MHWENWYTYFLVILGLDIAVFVRVYLRDRRRKLRPMELGRKLAEVHTEFSRGQVRRETDVTIH